MTKKQEEFIKQRMELPLMTNSINLQVDWDAFDGKYAIVSYYSVDENQKMLPYEELCKDTEFISVVGIRRPWFDGSWFTKFFVLTDKLHSSEVVCSLHAYDNIASGVDDIRNYDEKTQQRILASLAINSLGKRKDDSMMYSNGSLLVCDGTNFGCNADELVCLSIVVNDSLNLTAKVQSFCHPKTEGKLMQADTVFQVSKVIRGNWWNGKSVKPVTVRGQKKTKNFNLDDYYIKGKNDKRSKNIVPFWPFEPQNYIHGKLYVIKQVVSSVNDIYRDILKIEFCKHSLNMYYECDTLEDTLSFVKDYMAGKTIYFEDKINTESSKEHVKALKKGMNDYMNKQISFSRSEKGSDMQMILCEQEKEKAEDTLYRKSINRMMYEGIPIQHIEHSVKKSENKTDYAVVCRLLMELLVKDCIAKRKAPVDIIDNMLGWEFSLFREKDGCAIGAKMSMAEDGTLNIVEFGFPNTNLCGMKIFFQMNYLCNIYSKVKTFGNYYTMRKGGNSYIIVDTEEIPMLDAETIDNGYVKIAKENKTPNMFKNMDNANIYLNGYIGLYSWLAEDLQENQEKSTGYISGWNRTSIRNINHSSLDKMPRARIIHVMKADQPERVKQDISEIFELLKFGFGRSHELMTYPFPYKFLTEYLDNQSEIAFSCHWNDIPLKTKKENGK